jgi:hypothetical protein
LGQKLPDCGRLGNLYSVRAVDAPSSVLTSVFSAPVLAFGVDITANQAQTAIFGGGVTGSLALTANTPAFSGIIRTRRSRV